MTERATGVSAPYGGISPRIAGALAHVGAGAAVLGRVRLGPGAWLGAGSVIRADGHDVTFGAGFHLGRHGTVHIAHDINPTVVGDDVTAGDRAVIHACTVADGCVIGAGAIILDGSVIGPCAVLEPGTVVFPSSQLEGGWRYAGSPAKPVAPVSEADRLAARAVIRGAGPEGYHLPPPAPSLPQGGWIAPNAVIAGEVTAGAGAGIWYGCQIIAGHHRVTIGAGTNVQDNSVLIAASGDLVVGPDVTIGHNVTAIDARIDSGCLVGIGSHLAPGTVVEGDVLVAAGSRTEPGQRLTAGQVWAGSPARPIGAMDARKRGILAATLPTYRAYAEAFAATPHVPLTAG